MSVLAGKRILVLEDEALVAMMLQDMLLSLGAGVIGPVGTVESGLALAKKETIDAAVLDVNLNGVRADPVAEVLGERGIPIVFATGYAAETIEPTGAAPILQKPYTEKKLAKALTRALAVQQR